MKNSENNKKELITPAGHSVRVVSWENDGDFYNTKEVTGLTEEQAERLASFATLFIPYSDKGIGNLYWPTEAQQEVVCDRLYEFYLNNKDIVEVKEKDSTDKELICDYLIELAYDLGLSGGEQFTRTYSSIHIINYPEALYATRIA